MGFFRVKVGAGLVEGRDVISPDLIEGFGFVSLRELPVDDGLDINVGGFSYSDDVVGESLLVKGNAIGDVVKACGVVPVVSDSSNQVRADGVGDDGVDA